MNETFIPHKERDILEKVETEIKTAKEKVFEKISVLDKNKIENFLEKIKKENIEYFESEDFNDSLGDILEINNIDIENFETLINSIKERKKLISEINKKDINPLIKEKLKNIKNIDFLTIPLKERLQYITFPHIDSEVILNNKKEIIFNFTFEGKINNNLYLNTTAGQVLPEEILSVEKNGDTYSRNNLRGEFFTENNKRLTIHQDTHIIVSKLQSRDEVLEQKEKIKSELNIESEENLSTEDLIKFEAKLRGIDPDFAILSFSETLEKTPEEKREYVLENMLTEFDRVRGIYRLSGKLNKDGKYNDRLALEMFSQFGGKDWKEKAKNYGIEEKYIEDKNSMVKTDINMENIVDGEITQDLINKISKIKKFRPGSKEAVTLFTIACKIANIDESWAENPHLHKIMSNESGGIVGRLNYTIKGISFLEYRNRALNSNKNNPIGSKSTASGLGQLLLSNIDKFYPSGREGIGNPIEEAVGFIKYIEDRYGDPDVAISVYGKKGSYINSKTGKKEYKGFQEGY